MWEIETGKLIATIDQVKPSGPLEVKSNLLYFINGNEIVTWDIKVPARHAVINPELIRSFRNWPSHIDSPLKTARK